MLSEFCCQMPQVLSFYESVGHWRGLLVLGGLVVVLYIGFYYTVRRLF